METNSIASFLLTLITYTYLHILTDYFKTTTSNKLPVKINK